jgi:prepilin-type processing-associated H-X9-DG protein
MNAFPSLLRRRTAHGFTRIEALSAIAALMILVVLQLPLQGNTRSHSRMARCLSGMRQLQLAWTLYAADNDGRLVAAYNGGGDPALGPDWVGGTILDFNGGNPANTRPDLFPGKSPLLPYASDDPWIYRCPSDSSRVAVPTGVGTRRQTPRTRSRSLNCWVGGPGWSVSRPWQYASSLNQLVDPGPAETLTFLDEREESINDGYLAIDMTGYPVHRGDTVSGSGRVIVDFPAYWHDEGAGVAFADGHVNVQRWYDPRTRPIPRVGTLIPLNIPSPNNEDVFWLQSHSPRINR